MPPARDASRPPSPLSSTQRLVLRDRERGAFDTVEVPSEEIFLSRNEAGAWCLSSTPGDVPFVGLRSSSQGIVVTRSRGDALLNGRPPAAGERLGPYDLLEFAGALLRSEVGLTSSETDLSSIPLPSAANARPEERLPPVGGPPFAGRYSLQEVLGRGGFGAVYRAWDTQLQRPVAIKVLARAEGRALQRFAMEIRATASLRHPNLVTVYDSGIAGEHPYLVMELIEGPTLDRLAAEGLDPLRAAEVLRDVARAVAHVHARGMLHRDIKPMNIIVPPDGTARLVDFGLVRLLETEERETAYTRITREGTRLGTLPYMSPEQAFAGEQDERSEVYGLGATLYHALVGEHPFARSDELLLAIVNTEPTPPSERNPSVPADLDAVCLKCLAKRPKDRYSSAADLADDLDLLLAGDVPSACELTAYELAGRRLRRLAQRPWFAASAGVSAAFLLAGAVLLARLVVEQRRLDRERAAAERALAAQRAEEARRSAEARRAAQAKARRAAKLLRRLEDGARGKEVDLAALRVEALRLGAPLLPPLLDWIDRSADELAAARRGLLLSANELRRGEERLPQLEEALAARAHRSVRSVAPLEEERLLARARRRLQDRARSRVEPSSFENLVAKSQRARLGELRLQALDWALGVLAELARLGELPPRALPTLGGLLRVEGDPARAARIACLLAALPGADREALAALEEAAWRFGRAGPLEPAFAERLAALLRKAPPPAEEAAALLSRARAYVALSDEDAALATLDRSVAVAPFCAEAYVLRASLRRKQGELVAAESDLDEALDLAPRDLEARLLRARVRLDLGAGEGALADAREALKIDPDSAQAHVLAGLAHEAAKRWEEALRSYTAAVHADPSLAQAWGLRALRNASLRRPREAADDAREALRLDPDCASAWTARGVLALQARHLREALEHFARAIGSEPDEPSHYTNRAMAYLSSGNLRAARADLDAAIERTPRPRRGTLLTLRAMVRSSTGDAAGALADLDAAVKLAPADPLARRERARLRLLAGDARGALSDAEASVRGDGARRARSWAILAEARFATGDVEGGEEALREAFARDPTSSDALRARALRALDTGDAERALTDLDALSRKTPRDGSLWYHRARALAALGRAEEARPLLEAYLQRYPQGTHSEAARALLGRLRGK
ncbi:MAG: serine/threonine-protein kinase [Planctomycetota bacterium]|nr:MAG: serine/threonine-protein kinase [Planctomycetota bacterium]